MRKLNIFIFIVLSFSILTAVEAGAANRTALVIGNADYKLSPLKNPANDATDMAAILEDSGFDVTFILNASQREMKKAVRFFGKKLRQNKGEGLFYYAGHGIQLKGHNYLIPVGATIESEGDVEFEAVDAGLVLAKMEDAGNNMNIVILDACRNNPFARSFRSADKGLAKMDAPKGSLIAYATAPGSISADGEGKNGVYTKHLLTNIRKPGLTIERILKNVRVAVLSETSNKQVPWESSSLAGDFYFNQPEKKKASVPQKEDKNESSINSLDSLFWESIKDSKDAESFRAYLNQFPDGVFSELAELKIKQFSVQPEPETDVKGNLFVNTVPANARIRILNIKPKFRQGIELEPGKYLIEVTKTGYQAVTRWETLDAREKKTLEIRLEKQKILKKQSVNVASINPSDKEFNVVARDGQYIKYKNGIVYDRNTGLEWFVGQDKEIDWDEAKTWIESLDIDGGRWRMPSKSELKGLYNAKSEALLDVHDKFVWSSVEGGFSFKYGYFYGYNYRTTFPNSPCRAVAVRYRWNEAGVEKQKPLQNNSIKIGPINQADKEPAIAARDSQYIKYKNGIVLDENTELEWYAGPDKYMGGYAAKKWVKNLNLDGSGWRMPSESELKGIYKKGAGTRNMTPLLETSGWWVWSSVDEGFSFSYGRGYSYNLGGGCRAFAVRPRK